MPGRNLQIFEEYTASKLRISSHESGGYTLVQRTGKFLHEYTPWHAKN